MTSSSSVKGYLEEQDRGVSISCQEYLGMEEEEDLFEIDLDAVPPITQYYWESCSYITSTRNIALLANCLMPISHISSAIPASLAGNNNNNNTNVVLVTEPKPLGEYLRLPFLEAFGLKDDQEMKAKFHFQFHQR